MEGDPTIGMSAAGSSSATAPSTTPPSAPSRRRSARSRTSPGVGDRLGPRLGQYKAPELGEYELGDVDAVNGAYMLDPQDGDGRGRPARRGLLALHGRPRLVLPLQAGRLAGGLRRPRLQPPRQGRHDERRRATAASRHNLAFHRSMGRFYRKFYAGRNPLADVVIYLAIFGKLAISVTSSAIARRSFA